MVRLLEATSFSILVFTVSIRVSAYEFVPLRDMEGSSRSSFARDISGEGTIVVGTMRTPIGLQTEAFRWTKETGLVGLGDLGSGQVDSGAITISQDGTTIAGYATPEDEHVAIRWSERLRMERVVSSESSIQITAATGVSHDGSVIATYGPCCSAPGPDLFRWSEDSGFTLLQHPSGGSPGRVRDISADGSTLVGSVTTGSRSSAVLWREDGAIEILVPGRSGPNGGAEAIGVSSDGSVVAGDVGRIPNGAEAFRWTSDEGVTMLGIPDGFTDTAVLGLSPDGSTVVGYLWDEVTALSYAAIWREDRGWEMVRDTLEQRGVSIDGWHLDHVYAASSDGRMVAGNGQSPDGSQAAWLAILVPEPGTISLLTMAAFGLVGVRRRRVA